MCLGQQIATKYSQDVLYWWDVSTFNTKMSFISWQQPEIYKSTSSPHQIHSQLSFTSMWHHAFGGRTNSCPRSLGLVDISEYSLIEIDLCPEQNRKHDPFSFFFPHGCAHTAWCAPFRPLDGSSDLVNRLVWMIQSQFKANIIIKIGIYHASNACRHFSFWSDGSFVQKQWVILLPIRTVQTL